MGDTVLPEPSTRPNKKSKTTLRDRIDQSFIDHDKANARPDRVFAYMRSPDTYLHGPAPALYCFRIDRLRRLDPTMQPFQLRKVNLEALDPPTQLQQIITSEGMLFEEDQRGFESLSTGQKHTVTSHNAVYVRPVNAADINVNHRVPVYMYPENIAENEAAESSSAARQQDHEQTNDAGNGQANQINRAGTARGNATSQTSVPATRSAQGIHKRMSINSILE